MSPSVTEVILHCQKQLKKDQTQDKFIHYIERLNRLKIGTKDLIETGIGRTVNQLSRTEGAVGEKAYDLVSRWKALVEAERSESSAESNEETSSSEDEPEVLVPAVAVAVEEDKHHKRKRDEDDHIKHEEHDRQKLKMEYIDNEKHDRNNGKKIKMEVDVHIPRLALSRTPEKKVDTSAVKIKKEKGASHLPDKKLDTAPAPAFSPLKIKKEKDISSSSGKKSSTPEKKINSFDSLKPKLLPRLNVEIDSTSGVNFSDVLSGLDSKKIKRSPKRVLPPALAPSKRGESPTPSVRSSSSSATVSSSTQKSMSTEPSYAPSTSSSSIGSLSSYMQNIPKSSTTTKAIAKVKPFVHSTTTTPAASSSKPVVSQEQAKILKDLTAPLGEDRYWEDSRMALNGSYHQQSDADALSNMMSSRNQRTKVYSGVKVGHSGKITTLFEMCIRVLQENIEDLEYTGGIPFDILEPVLNRATVQQLMNIEHFNPYLIEFTDNIWKYHCSQNFRGRTPDEFETWRELYYRCSEERNARFESLTSKLKSKIEESTPVRKTKLAYVESTSGPKFSKSKAATIKSGMSSLKTREEKGLGRNHASSASSGGGGNNNNQNVLIEEASVIIPAKSRAGSAPAPSSSRDSNNFVAAAAKKPKKAPLMQKTLKSMKTLMRR